MNPTALGIFTPSELDKLSQTPVRYPVPNLLAEGSTEIPAGHSNLAQRPLVANGTFGKPSAAYKLWTIHDLDTYPAPEWLIAGLLMADSHSVLVGAPGEGKSFVALSFALAVASGRAWMGRDVKQGPVVYIAAEGGRGILKRIHAWQKEHSVDNVESLRLILDAPQLRSHSDILKVLSTISEMPQPPILIVIDTLARTFVGGEENAAKDMGEWIEGAHRLQKQTGAAILSLHHTAKRVARNRAITERGSSALRGAVDTLMAITKQDESLTLSCQKQKDEEEFSPISLRLKQVDVSLKPGDPQRSLVVVNEEAAAETEPSLSKGAQVALTALMNVPGTDVSKSQWKAVVERVLTQETPERTFMNWVTELIDSDKVERKSRGTYRLKQSGSATAIQMPITAIQQAA